MKMRKRNKPKLVIRKYDNYTTFKGANIAKGKLNATNPSWDFTIEKESDRCFWLTKTHKSILKDNAPM